MENTSISIGLQKANQFKDNINIVTLCPFIPPFTFSQFAFFARHD